MGGSKAQYHEIPVHLQDEGDGSNQDNQSRRSSGCRHPQISWCRKISLLPLVIVKPGGMRELHWHPNASEWQFYIAGKARMTVFYAGRQRAHDGLQRQ